MSASRSDLKGNFSRRRFTRFAILACAVAGTTKCWATDRFFLSTGNDPDRKWEDPSLWTGDTPPGGPPPAANDSSELIYVANGGVGAYVKIDAATMAYYQAASATTDPFHHLNVGSPLNYGSVVMSNGSTSPGQLTMGSGGTLSASQLFVAGWGVAAGTGPGTGGGVGTLIMSGGEIDVNNGTFAIGDSNNSTALGFGTVLMNSGTISLGNGTIFLSFTNSYGTLIQSGGDITTNKTIYIGGSSTTAQSGGSGDYELQGGSFSCATLNFGRGVGNSVAGGNTFDLTGGSLSAGSVGINYTTDDPTNHPNTFLFAGGTLTANTFRMTMNQSGGTLSPGQALVAGSGSNVGSIILLTDTNASHSSAGLANYTQGSAGHLLLDVTSGGSSDVVTLEDNGGTATAATLNGEIDINADAGYTPTIGDTFNGLSADSISDSSTIKPANDSNLIFTKSVLTNQTVPTNGSGGTNGSGNILQIAFAGHARPGDATRNEAIDSNDFAALAAHYDQSGAGIGWGEGDFNGDGTVNALDFNALATNFGKGGTVENPVGADLPDAAAALGSVVPEPLSATILLGAMGLGLIGRNRRRTI